MKSILTSQAFLFPFLLVKLIASLGELIWREKKGVRKKVEASFCLEVLITKERRRKGRDLKSLHKPKNLPSMQERVFSNFFSVPVLPLIFAMSNYIILINEFQIILYYCKIKIFPSTHLHSQTK